MNAANFNPNAEQLKTFNKALEESQITKGIAKFKEKAKEAFAAGKTLDLKVLKHRLLRDTAAFTNDVANDGNAVLNSFSNATGNYLIENETELDQFLYGIGTLSEKGEDKRTVTKTSSNFDGATENSYNPNVKLEAELGSVLFNRNVDGKQIVSYDYDETKFKALTDGLIKSKEEETQATTSSGTSTTPTADPSCKCTPENPSTTSTQTNSPLATTETKTETIKTPTATTITTTTTTTIPTTTQTPAATNKITLPAGITEPTTGILTEFENLLVGENKLFADKAALQTFTDNPEYSGPLQFVLNRLASEKIKPYLDPSKLETVPIQARLVIADTLLHSFIEPLKLSAEEKTAKLATYKKYFEGIDTTKTDALPVLSDPKQFSRFESYLAPKTTEDNTSYGLKNLNQINQFATGKSLNDVSSSVSALIQSTEPTGAASKWTELYKNIIPRLNPNKLENYTAFTTLAKNIPEKTPDEQAFYAFAIKNLLEPASTDEVAKKLFDSATPALFKATKLTFKEESGIFCLTLVSKAGEESIASLKIKEKGIPYSGEQANDQEAAKTVLKSLMGLTFAIDTSASGYEVSAIDRGARGYQVIES